MICAIRAFGFEPIAADGMHYRTFMLELAANALWNVTDENPLASKYFARVALHTYIQLLDVSDLIPGIPVVNLWTCFLNLSNFVLIASCSCSCVKLSVLRPTFPMIPSFRSVLIETSFVYWLVL